LIVQGLYQFKPPLPFSPGAELAGIVESVGEGVRHFKAGDRVIASTGHGAFAERCVANETHVSPLPAGMDFELGAAFVLTYGTSLHALQQIAKLQAGETLLVLGAAGGVGLAAIEIAKAMGARVIAAASSAEKLALCKQIGADETINYEEEELRKRVDAMTDGKGVDVVYDAVGGRYSEPALRATGWRGRFLVVGFAAGEIPKLPLNLALLKERAILGVFWGDAVRRNPAQHLASMKQLGAWFNEGKVKPFISERISLEQAADGIARMAARQVKGKVVVVPGR
ncbi:MAG TPA: NADPH:quinone oxidoreductase family protein, partial [Pararobbsia sp.]|nr:NADPH:quinone oxidoreductase family protein [Pararobbsia sp.]